jgi:aspartate kinase
MKTLVMKFGGTSVGNAEAIAQAAEIVRVAQKDSPSQVVIVSAMSGVTDLLLKGAHTAASGDSGTFRAIARDLHARHETAINSLLDAPAESHTVRDRVQFYLTEYENLCHAVNILGEATPRALDAIGSLGERMSIHL